MNLQLLVSILLLTAHLSAGESKRLESEDSNITLGAPEGWDIKKGFGDTSIYPPNQPAHSSQSRIHLVALDKDAVTLKTAVEAEIDLITQRSPESSNSRKAFKGSVPVKTASGIAGLRADFYTEHEIDGVTVRRYQIVKYYFQDGAGKTIKVCAHVYGDEDRMKMFESTVLNNLTTNKNN